MKTLLLILILAISTIVHAQWLEKSQIPEFDGCLPETSMGNTITFFNDSTGVRVTYGSYTPSSAWWDYKYIQNYGNSYNNDTVWGSGGSDTYNYQQQYNSGPKKPQFISLDTVLYTKSAFVVTFNSISISYDALNTESSLFSTGNAEITDYFFVDKDFGFICLLNSDTNTLINYNNGLLDTIYSTTNYKSSKIIFVNDSIGFLQNEDFTTNNKSLIKTEDYGQNWISVFDSLPSSYKEITFLSDSLGFVTLLNNSIYKTVDTGNTWELVDLDYSEFSGIYDFVTPSLWYAVLNNDSLFKSYDSGNNWVYDSLTVSNIQDIEIISDSIGYAIGYNCKLYTKGKNYMNTNINNYMQELISVNIYPNPTTGQITIESDKTIEQVKIISITGKTVKQITINKEQLTIDLSAEAKGIYFVKLTTANGVTTQKLVLE